MEIQEAIDLLDCTAFDCDHCNRSFRGCKDKEKFEEMKTTIVEALEKQIPRPPENKVHKKYKMLGKNCFCKCGVMFIDWERNKTNYCGNCGQKLREVRLNG